jgi:hypothetical protein
MKVVLSTSAFISTYLNLSMKTEATKPPFYGSSSVPPPPPPPLATSLSFYFPLRRS